MNQYKIEAHINGQIIYITLFAKETYEELKENFNLIEEYAEKALLKEVNIYTNTLKEIQ